MASIRKGKLRSSKLSGSVDYRYLKSMNKTFHFGKHLLSTVKHRSVLFLPTRFGRSCLRAFLQSSSNAQEDIFPSTSNPRPNREYRERLRNGRQQKLRAW